MFAGLLDKRGETARQELAEVPPTEPVSPHVEQLYGPARSLEDIFQDLDEQYRKVRKLEVWFLPLDEPISPHLNELLGPIETPEEYEPAESVGTSCAPASYLIASSARAAVAVHEARYQVPPSPRRKESASRGACRFFKAVSTRKPPARVAVFGAQFGGVAIRSARLASHISGEIRALESDSTHGTRKRADGIPGTTPE